MKEKIKITLVVIIAAIIVSGGAYYFWGNKNLTTESSKQENVVFNQSSKEYAMMGRDVWSAFECSSWASEINDTKEVERLFLFGYEQGKKFLDALNAGKIEQEDISQEVPIGVTMLLQGPSEEFILGRIYSFAEEEALGEVFKTGDDYNSKELQEIIASNKFQDGNCELVGK